MDTVFLSLSIYLVPGPMLSSFHRLCCLNLPAILWGGSFYYRQFPNEETEAQSSCITCPNSGFPARSVQFQSQNTLANSPSPIKEENRQVINIQLSI